MIGRSFSTVEMLLPTELSESDREDMLRLFSSYYRFQDNAHFFSDLAKKTHIFLMRDEGGRIRGFSSLLVYHSTHQGRTIQVFFSGDTIIERDFRGGSQFPMAWIRTILTMADASPYESFWFLISGGHRTYRYLPLFCKKYYPGIGNRNDFALEPLAWHLAREMFADDFCVETGVVRFADGATPLIPAESQIRDARLENPHIAFFQSRNPLHFEGDELVCLAKVSVDNLTAATFRVIGADGAETR